MHFFAVKIPDIGILPRFTRQQLCRGPMWSDPKVRPPILEEMMPDIERVIASVALRYMDNTTPHLQFDELVGEGRLKLSELITRGELDRQLTRLNFFKFLKTSLNNQARSRVQKYRFTEKRTGQKAPPREQRFKPESVAPAPEEGEAEEHVPEYHKNVELSLDDPDLGLQVPQVAQHSERDVRDIEEEYEALLEEIEKIVFRQMHHPNEKACCYALEDAYRKRPDDRLHIKVRTEHLARGLGVELKEFEKTVLSIRHKIVAYRSMSDEEQDTEARRNARVATLKQIFNLQIPQGLDDMVIRRLFTMAARDQYDTKVKGRPEVVEMLLEVGAKPPRLIGDKMTCYGVLYQKNCRKCNTCDLRHSCAVEAANMGLTKMVISPKLLGARQMRLPTFLPRTSDIDSRISSNDEAEVIAHLDETFEKAEKEGVCTYFHRVGEDNRKRVLFVVEQSSPLQLRFCNPSDALKEKLVDRQKSWRPRDDAPLSEIIALIEQHAKETFE